MTRAVRLAAVAAGLAILGFLTFTVGLETLVDGVQAVGWLAVPIVALHAVVYGLNAVAWWLTLSTESGAPAFRTIFRISLVGFAINFLTPVVNAGGEPYRVAALTPWIGTRRAAGSVLQYAMLHALSSLLMWLTAIGAALTLPTVQGALRLGLCIAGVAIAAALVMVQRGHRHGFVQRSAAWLARRRLGKLSTWVARRDDAFAAIDAQLATMHSAHPGRLALAVAVDYLSRWVAMGELLLVANGLGLPMTVLSAVMISGLSALAVNVLFLLPWEMGSREGSLFLLFGLAGVPASVGMIAAVLTRLREIVWCGIGLLLAGRANIPRPTPSP